MISENDRKYLSLIENLTKQCLRKLDDLYFIRSTFSDLIRVYENMDDKALKTIFLNRSKEICILEDSDKIKRYLKELQNIIKEKLSQSEQRFIVLGNIKIEKSEKYNRDQDRYKNENISEAEEKILNSPVYQEKLHEPLIDKNKSWGENRRHARLGKNLRIIYLYIPKKKFVFEAIVTHDELDKN